MTGKYREDRWKEIQSEPERSLLEKEKAAGAGEPPRSQAGVLRRLPRREKMTRDQITLDPNVTQH